MILVGFMGAGKTTVGRMLAGNLGWQFTDLDDLVVAHEGRAIADIFRASGEAFFRRVETECLREILRGRPSRTVIALGGGAIVQPENAALVRDSKVPVVFLDAPSEVLMARCAPEPGTRPLFADENQFRQLYESRRKSYMSAGVRIDTASLSPAAVAEEIVRRLDLRAHN
ncbi:MAG: shikimate kinase [Terriglobales bacterium]